MSAHRRSASRLQASATPDRGYSLVEVLVALFIVALLSAAGFGALNSTLSTQEFLNAREERLRELQLGRAILREDISQLAPLRPVRSAFGAPEPVMFHGGYVGADEPVLAFLRTGWTNPGGLERRGPQQYVEYFLRDGAFVRRTRARPDMTPDTPVSERVVFTGVMRVSTRFSGPNWTQGPIWVEEWRADSRQLVENPGLPRLVELELEFEDMGVITHMLAAPALTLPIQGES